MRYDDVTAVVDAFRTALKLDGEPAGSNYRMSIASHFFALIDYGRRSGTADTLSAAFVRDPANHRTPEEETNEDEIGKAIFEPVIRQLDAHLHLLGHGRARGQRTLAPDDLQLMYRTLYILLRDSGRRPLEICSLPRDCLEARNDQICLVWNNHKARRQRRRLPITTPTAQAIRTWKERREQLQSSLPPTGADYLFPALTHLATRPYLPTNYLGETLRDWADSIPHLHSEGTDTHGNPLPFDRSLIYAYAFRHSYAQRHADAGTPLDVLRELMDHKSVSTTQRYYTVSLKRKRDAVTKLAAHVVDHHGRPSPSSPTPRLPAPPASRHGLPTPKASASTSKPHNNVGNPPSPPPARTRSTTATLPTELELARQEIRALREDRDRMRQAIQHQLGQQLDALDTGHLTERVNELTRTNQRLEDSLQQATDDNHQLHARVRTLETDLAAARTSLRRMIREENTSR
ncbi:tyrosine-type recombinase/integrase [Streptomyces pseudogriseolus]|uniref:tyrosine-type recombinase/integrase n=1 Tax=Streptomyces pseudogriseolus TaxID=36817 RepID=UPI003FA21A76